jgi:ribosomal protein S18 acetylase RimI-like enzyme
MDSADVGILRSAEVEDASAVATLHCTSISEGFLATLGTAFLRRLYRRMVQSRHAFLIVSTSGEGHAKQSIAGFVAGSGDLPGLYRQFMMRDGLMAAWSAAPRLVAAAPRAIETFRYGARQPKSDETTEAEDGEVELLSLAVDPTHRRHGRGSSLVAAFLDQATRSGAPSARVVVGARNERAIRVYRAAGFEPVGTVELHRGAASLVLRVALPGPGTP